MTRTENDLREALLELQQRADQHGAPATASLVAAINEDRLHRHEMPGTSRRWLPPLAAAAVVAAAAVAAVAISADHGNSTSGTPALGQPSSVRSSTHHVVPPAPRKSTAVHHSAADPTAVLEDAAAKLDTAPWSAPDPAKFFYVRTNLATTWSSVSGTQEGDGRAADGTKIWVSGCKDGHLVSGGESGDCTLSDVPHYLTDAPTTPAAWDNYLEQMAPGAKAANAQGKIIVEALHQDLVAPKAAAALLRYTESCPGLHTVDVQPVAGESLTGVTCPSMTNGSYGLAFDATTHAFVGFVAVTGNGDQDGPAEIVQQTAIVSGVDVAP